MPAQHNITPDLRFRSLFAWLSIRASLYSGWSVHTRFEFNEGTNRSIPSPSPITYHHTLGFSDSIVFADCKMNRSDRGELQMAKTKIKKSVWKLQITTFFCRGSDSDRLHYTLSFNIHQFAWKFQTMPIFNRQKRDRQKAKKISGQWTSLLGITTLSSWGFWLRNL